MCTCRRSRCLKLYCKCMHAGNYCDLNCSCHDCKNNEEYKKQLNRAYELGMARKDRRLKIAGCHCVRSQCKTKHCACAKAGEACSMMCNCVNCHNEIRPRFEMSPYSFPEARQHILSPKEQADLIFPPELEWSDSGTPTPHLECAELAEEEYELLCSALSDAKPDDYIRSFRYVVGSSPGSLGVHVDLQGIHDLTYPEPFPKRFRPAQEGETEEEV